MCVSQLGIKHFNFIVTFKRITTIFPKFYLKMLPVKNAQKSTLTQNVVDGISTENVSVVEVPTVALFTASVKNVHMLMISFA